MNTIIFILIIFFILLFGFSILDIMVMRRHPMPYAAFSDAWPFCHIYTVHEGMEGDTSGNATPTPTNYQDYSPNDSMILSQQNAGNIQFLKGRVDDLGHTNERIVQHIFDISNNLTVLNDQVDTIVQQQAQYAQSVAPESVPPMDLSMPDSITTTDTTSSGL